MKHNLSNVVAVVVMFLYVGVFAQEQQVSSLLSNYGIGSIFSESTIAEKSQGDLSVVSNNTKEVISLANPALLGDLRLTSLAVSIQALGANVQTTSSDYASGSVAISNLTLGVPLGKIGAFSMGLRSHSAVGYEVDSSDFYNVANGGVNQFFIGVGFNVLENLTVGAQMSRYFGKTNKEQVFKELLVSSKLEYEYNVTGVSTRIGVQYKYKLSKSLEAIAGAYGILGHTLKADGTSTFSDVVGLSQVQERDISGIEKNPFKTALGVGLGKENNWFAGVSYEFRDAVTYSGNAFNNSTGAIPVSFEGANKISLGGYIIPKKYALKNYLNRIAYRGGFKYEKTGLMMNNESVKNLGISFGLGLPVGRRVSYMNFSFELGRIGDFSKNKYQEEYFNVGIELSLSDKWFNKRVID